MLFCILSHTKNNGKSLVHAESKCMAQDLLLWHVSTKFLIVLQPFFEFFL